MGRHVSVATHDPLERKSGFSGFGCTWVLPRCHSAWNNIYIYKYSSTIYIYVVYVNTIYTMQIGYDEVQFIEIKRE